MEPITPLSNTTISAGNSGHVIEYNIFFLVLFAILILAAAVLNFGTIIAFWRLPSLRQKPSELLILNLAVADFITGVLLLPIASPLYITPGHWPIGESGCMVAVGFLNLGIHGSLFALTTISIDRFLLVFMEYPNYIKTVTRERIYGIIISGWVFVFVTIALELGMWHYAKEIDASARSIPFHVICLSPPRRVRTFSLTIFLLLYFFPVILVCGMSFAFLYQLKNRLVKTLKRRPTATSKVTKSHTSEVELRTTGSSSDNLTDDAPSKIESSTVTSPDSKVHRTLTRQARNRYIKPGITLLALVVAMAICMLPYCFYVIIVESGCERCNNPKVLFGLLLLQFCNAVLDPFIYVLTRKKLRKFWRSSLCMWKGCNETDNRLLKPIKMISFR